jgi:hypothetical protein
MFSNPFLEYGANIRDTQIPVESMVGDIPYQLYSIPDFCLLGRLQNMVYSTTSCAEFTKTFLLSTFHTFHKVEFKHFISFKHVNAQMDLLRP